MPPRMNIFYPSVISRLPEKLYRAEPALSQTALRNFSMSPTPLHFFHQHMASHRHFLIEETKNSAMKIGTITHARLELKTEEAFEACYVKMPKGMRKVGKPYKELQEQHKGKTLVSTSDWDFSLELFKGVKKNKTALELLNSGEPEESFFFKHNEQKVKGRFDLRVDKHGVIADWKTCISADPRDGFKKAILNSRLDWQAAFYKAQADKFFPHKSHEFVFICVEKSYPFACSLITLSRADMARAYEQVLATLDEVTKRINEDNWGDGYGDRIWTIKLGA